MTSPASDWNAGAEAMREEVALRIMDRDLLPDDRIFDDPVRQAIEVRSLPLPRRPA